MFYNETATGNKEQAKTTTLFVILCSPNAKESSHVSEIEKHALKLI
jgi:hypothetical protein